MAVAFEGRAEDESSERNLLRGYEFSMPVFSRRKFGPLLGKKKFSNGFGEIIYSIEYFIL